MFITSKSHTLISSLLYSPNVYSVKKFGCKDDTFLWNHWTWKLCVTMCSSTSTGKSNKALGFYKISFVFLQILARERKGYISKHNKGFNRFIVSNIEEQKGIWNTFLNQHCSCLQFVHICGFHVQILTHMSLLFTKLYIFRDSFLRNTHFKAACIVNVLKLYSIKITLK